jgi:ADP-ribose pyrophosphatase
VNKYFKEIEYKEISRKVAYKGKRVQVEELEYLNGDKIIYREHVKAGNASVILPITDDNKVIIIQEPRTPIGKVILALPAGIIEEGEDATNAAVRELEEETGYLASNIEFLREYHPSVGYSDEKIKIYLSTNMKKTKQKLDAEEDINVIEVPLEEVINMVDKNEIITASTTIAIMHYLLYKKK